jgi:hypothetical protein
MIDRFFAHSLGNDSKNSSWLLAIVLLAAVAVYANTLSMGFVWDDNQVILEPSPIRSLENIPYFFKNSVSAGHKFGNTTPYYRPVFSLSNAIDYFFWGVAPFGYHLTNILLHAAVSGLVFLIATRILTSGVAGLFAGLVYALHPVHVEAVAYVSARNELLCALFMAAAMHWYLRCRDRLTPVNVITTQAIFFAALLSKEMAVTMPLLIGFYEISAGGARFKKAFLRALPFAVSVVGYLLLRSIILEVTSWESPPLNLRLLTGIGLVASYLRLLVFPFGLKTLYDIPIKWELFEADVLAPLLLVLIPVLLAIFLFRRDRRLFFGISWIYIALIPASGLPGLIIPAFMSERYLYIPSIGFALICGRLAAIALQSGVNPSSDAQALLRKKLPHSIFLLAVIGLLLIYAGITVLHSRCWQDEPTFYRTMISDAPAHQLGYDLLGSYYGKRNANQEMAKYYMQSMQLAKKQQVALGDSYMKYRYYDKAEDAFSRLIDAGYGDESIKKRLAYVKKVKAAPLP